MKIQLFHFYGVVFALFLFSSCSREPQPIAYGQDPCSFCKMTIVDKRFGGEIMSKTGKPFKFDDAVCIEEFLRNGYLEESKVEAIYLTDYRSGVLFKAESTTSILKNPDLKSPMGSNIAAFSSEKDINSMHSTLGGEIITWEKARPELHHTEAMNGL